MLHFNFSTVLLYDNNDGKLCMCLCMYVYGVTVYNICIYLAPRRAAGRVLTPRCTGNMWSVSRNPPPSTAKKVLVKFYILNVITRN